MIEIQLEKERKEKTLVLILYSVGTFTSESNPRSYSWLVCIPLTDETRVQIPDGEAEFFAFFSIDRLRKVSQTPSLSIHFILSYLFCFILIS